MYLNHKIVNPIHRIKAEESAYMRNCEKKLIDQLDPLIYLNSHLVIFMHVIQQF